MQLLIPVELISGDKIFDSDLIIYSHSHPAKGDQGRPPPPFGNPIFPGKLTLCTLSSEGNLWTYQKNISWESRGGGNGDGQIE